MTLPNYAIHDLHRKADELAAGYLAGPGRVGLAVGVLVGDERFHMGYGAVGKGSEQVPGERTVFEIGSVTKVFTAILLAEMVARGEVKLDQPVRELLPPGTTVPKRGDREVTLLDLATHTAGLPRMSGNWQEGMKDEANPYAHYTPELLYQALAKTKLRWRPGTKDDYSNYGVGLLGHALELRAAKPYAELLTDRVLRPLGLDDTTVDLSDDQRRRLAPGHLEDGQPTANWDIRTLGGAGALRSTMAEMLTFLRANLNPAATPLAEALSTCQRPTPLIRKFPPWWAVAMGLAAVSILVQWLLPVPPGTWKFAVAVLLPVVVSYVWRGFGAGVLASFLVWVGAFLLWGSDQFGWMQAALVLGAIGGVAFKVRRFLPSAGAGGEVMPGWQAMWFGDMLVRWHNGGTGGYCSFVGFVADSRVAVAVLANSANDVDSIGVELLRHLHETNKVWATVPRTFKAAGTTG
jgi:CubicO group peptidase (beta-lactamase class C family)